MIMRNCILFLVLAFSSLPTTASEIRSTKKVWEAFFKQAEDLVKANVINGLYTEDNVEDSEPFVLTNPIAGVMVQLLIRSRTLHNAFRLADGSIVPFAFSPDDYTERQFFNAFKTAKVEIDALLKEDDFLWSQLLFRVLSADVNPESQIPVAEKEKFKDPSEQVKLAQTLVFKARQSVEKMPQYTANYLAAMARASRGVGAWRAEQGEMEMPEPSAPTLAILISNEVERPILSALETRMMLAFISRLYERLEAKKPADQTRVSDQDRLCLGILLTLEANLKVGSRMWNADDGFELGLNYVNGPGRIVVGNCPRMFIRMYPILLRTMKLYQTLRVSGDSERKRPALIAQDVEKEAFECLNEIHNPGFFGGIAKRFATTLWSKEDLLAKQSQRRQLAYLLDGLSEALLAFQDIRKGLKKTDNLLKGIFEEDD